MKKNISKILLIGIILIASFLRLWQLGATPSSPDWDEVALGYDAYSIAHTGRDEFGNFLPVVLRSFDDYKPALYAYLAVPAVEVFGLSVFAVRLPSAIFGIMTVLACYFLVKELFKRVDLALLSSFLLSISPWHVQFSRVAFETNVGLAFNILMALFFLKGIRRPWILCLSAISAAMAIYAYQSEKIFTPLLLLALVVIYYKEILSVPRKFLLAAVVTGLIFVSPMVIYIATHNDALLRAQATLAFADKTVFLKNDIMRLQQDRERHDLLGLMFDNRRVLYLKAGIAGYLSHFNLNWLFIKGDINRHHAPGMGLLYLWELPLFLIGLYHLAFNKVHKKENSNAVKLTLAWFFIAPIPAAFTSGVPHAVRTINFLPSFQIFTAFGIISLIGIIIGLRRGVVIGRAVKIVSIGYMIFAFFNFVYYIDQYFVQQNYFNAYDWQYGYEKAIPEIQTISKNYKRVVVSDRGTFDKSYMFFLFYLRYSPMDYQKIQKNNPKNFASNHNFDKFEFRLIDWNKDESQKDTLFIGGPDDFNKDVKSVNTVNLPNGESVIKIVEGGI